MIKFPRDKVNVKYDKKKEIFSVSFKMTRALYEQIDDINTVEDVGLGILAEMNIALNKEVGGLDTPDTPPVDIPKD